MDHNYNARNGSNNDLYIASTPNYKLAETRVRVFETLLKQTKIIQNYHKTSIIQSRLFEVQHILYSRNNIKVVGYWDFERDLNIMSYVKKYKEQLVRMDNPHKFDVILEFTSGRVKVTAWWIISRANFFIGQFKEEIGLIRQFTENTSSDSQPLTVSMLNKIIGVYLKSKFLTKALV